MKFKSLLEKDFASALKKNKISFQYEADRIPYVRPSNYVPDWKIGENLFLETKGEFTPSHRSNLLAFLEQHPKIKIIMVFAQANNRLNRNSKMTYGEWCDRHGIEYFDLRAQYNKNTKSYKFGAKLPRKWVNDNQKN